MIVYSLTVVSCIFCTIFNQKVKNLMSQTVWNHDAFMVKRFSMLFDNEKFKRKIRKRFILFLCLVLSIMFYLTTSIHLLSPEFIYYSWFMNIVTHIVQLQSFHIYAFMITIEDRLKLLSKFHLDTRGKSETISGLVHKKLLINIVDMVEQTENLFSPSLKLVLIILYVTLLTNFYWIGLSLLGYEYASIWLALFIVCPNIVIIASLAKCDHNIKKALLNFIRSRTLSLSNGNEDILIFAFGKKFFVDHIGFPTIVKVRRFVALNNSLVI